MRVHLEAHVSRQSRQALDIRIDIAQGQCARSASGCALLHTPCNARAQTRPAALIEAGRMQAPGHAQIEAAKADGR